MHLYITKPNDYFYVWRSSNMRKIMRQHAQKSWKSLLLNVGRKTTVSSLVCAIA